MKTLTHRCDPRRTNRAKAAPKQKAGPGKDSTRNQGYRANSMSQSHPTIRDFRVENL